MGLLGALDVFCGLGNAVLPSVGAISRAAFVTWAGRGAQGGFAEQGAEEQSSVCARWVPSCQPKGTEAAFGPSFTRPGLTPALGSALPSSSLEAAEQQLLGLPAAPFGLPQHFPSHFPAVFS